MLNTRSTVGWCSRLGLTALLWVLWGVPTYAQRLYFQTPPGTYPEGVTFDARTRQFFVSSLKYGTIGRIDATGTYHPFIRDPDLITSVGLHVDARRNRLLVCVTDAGVGPKSSDRTINNLARVIEYELPHGRRRRVFDLNFLLPGAHIANDLTFDPDGNVYVTDSLTPAVYKIDQAGQASVFLTSEALQFDGINLNGIVYHPDGYLLLASYSGGLLWKLPLQNPGAFSEVRLEESILGADGMVLRSDGKLAVVRNSSGLADPAAVKDRIDLLISADGWRSSRIEQTFTDPSLDVPTTAVEVQGKTFVLNARDRELFADPQTAWQFLYWLDVLPF
ncbi:SMP-30/gluconolactonase/LRE family protein [Gloeobacter violaceus]|uniref:Gll2823 protein n=1 Tax=Gloeobacter violaceus (strain ATCC 29082 / PCC 7421) TaxID=251221 RepID=Q7ND03_GLOVI|nr:SMP-30/gluconolactonase/LRE family protein [Gloeobacter violaceus]BAC90764.1 gll2823 [Gloeobacter violaceus PCC 7421]